MHPKYIIGDLKNFCAGLSDAEARTELQALINEAEEKFDSLECEISELSGQVDELQSGPESARGAAIILCDWSRRESPEVVSRVVSAIQAGAASDLYRYLAV